jgi:hypothetical protein
MTLKRRSEHREDTGDYEKLANGEYEGRLVYVADLGLQKREYKGEVKSPAQQISLGIEILGQPVQIDGEDKPRVLWVNPFNVFHELNAKGKEMMVYKIFDAKCQEGQVADWDSVLGMPCNVAVGKRTSKDGKNEYDNIDALTPIPKKYQGNVAQSEIEPCIGDADDDTNPCTMALFGLAKFVFEKRIEEDAPY